MCNTIQFLNIPLFVCCKTIFAKSPSQKSDTYENDVQPHSESTCLTAQLPLKKITAVIWNEIRKISKTYKLGLPQAEWWMRLLVVIYLVRLT